MAKRKRALNEIKDYIFESAIPLNKLKGLAVLLESANGDYEITPDELHGIGGIIRECTSEIEKTLQS